MLAFTGEVVKFAGDALYAIWTSDLNDESDSKDKFHSVCIEKCTACAITINALCNNYKISKSYNNRRRSSMDMSVASSDRSQGDVLYKYQDKNAKYEERGSILNVYCGVSEGVMAGIDVLSSNRAEFFLFGKPLEGEIYYDKL